MYPMKQNGHADAAAKAERKKANKSVAKATTLIKDTEAHH